MGRPLDTDGEAAANLIPLLTDYLDDLATRTADRLGDVAGVAVTLQFGGQAMTVGSSSPLAADVDAIQFEVGTGPCLHVLQGGPGMYVPDLGNDPRWGEYGPRAAARGAACCLSLPVRVDDRPVAAFKVYASRVDGLTSEQRATAERSAADVVGGIGLAMMLSTQARALDDRRTAMDSRRTIDLALGVLIERHHCDAGAAFAMLREQSQDRNVKLRDVARETVLSAAETTSEQDLHAPFNSPGQRSDRGGAGRVLD